MTDDIDEMIRRGSVLTLYESLSRQVLDPILDTAIYETVIEMEMYIESKSYENEGWQIACPSARAALDAFFNEAYWKSLRRYQRDN